jgi:hypothetical protein
MPVSLKHGWSAACVLSEKNKCRGYKNKIPPDKEGFNGSLAEYFTMQFVFPSSSYAG